MSARKKKNVQSAKEQKPEDAKEPQAIPEPVEVASQEKAPTASDKEIPKLIEIPQVDEDTKKMLQKAGFGWDSFVRAFERINVWAESVDGRFNIIGNALEKMPTNEGIAEELKKKLIEQSQKQMQAQPSTGNVGGGGLGNILQLLPQILPMVTGGGSSELQNKIMDMAIESMGLGNALVKAIILKTAPELATQLLPPIVPKT